MLTQALLLVHGLLPEAAALAEAPVQASASLQSAPSHVDPDMNYPLGTVCFTQIWQQADDLRDGIERFIQPVLVVMAAGTSSPPRRKH